MALQFDETELARLRWILDADAVNAAEEFGFRYLATTGSGPFSEGEFDDLLRDQGFELFFPRQVPDELEVLVVGRWDWDESELDALLEERSGKTLRVYSQELFAAFLVAGVDPLEEDERTLRQLAGDHPALAFLEEMGFDWPSTQIVGLGKRPPDIVAPERGFLRYCGYRVGKQGVTRARRRVALRRVYESHVPSSLAGAGYASEWASPQSCKRLEKMAVTIASLCRGQKQKREPAELAIKHWQEDLDWLKSEYYRGRCRFSWPNTGVR